MSSRSQLADLAVTYRITVLGRAVLDCLPAATLLELIVLGVSRGRPQGPRLSLTPPMPALGVPARTAQSVR
jgi:hypothetical protein